MAVFGGPTTLYFSRQLVHQPMGWPCRGSLLVAIASLRSASEYIESQIKKAK
jgi:hypothetical protein